MKGLDLNKFKKVSEDHQTATLSHPHGHEIKIAKSALSKTLRDQLDDLPYAKGGEVKEHNPSKFAEDYAKKHAEKFPKPIPKEKQGTGPNGPIGAQRSEAFLSRAKGGDVKGVHEPYGERNITHTMSEKEREGASLAGEAVRAGSRGDESGRRVGKSEHKRVLEEMRSMKKPHLMAHGGYMPMADGEDVESPEQASVGQSYPAIETEQVQSNPSGQVFNASDEFDKWQNDKINGHIEPKKMSDYFADASVPGKLGMIFGALAGGIGSGLTHQPSAFLTMMQKQIDNDMAAQQSSKEMGYKANVLAMHQRETEARIKRWAAENGLTQAQTRGLDIENGRQHLLFQNMVKNQAFAENLVKEIDAMPEGPHKTARINALGLVLPMLNDQNSTLKARSEAGMRMLNGPSPQEGQAPSPGTIPTAKPLGQADRYAGNVTNAMDLPPGASSDEIISSIKGGGQRVYNLITPNAIKVSGAFKNNAYINSEELQKQIKAADNAEYALNGPKKNGVNGIDDTIDDMYRSIGSGAYLPGLESSVRQNLEDVPYVGKALESVGNMFISPTESYKNYDKGKQKIINDVGAALHEYVSKDEIARAIAPFFPVRGDTREMVEKKKEDLRNFVIKSYPKTELKKANLSLY